MAGRRSTDDRTPRGHERIFTGRIRPGQERNAVRRQGPSRVEVEALVAGNHTLCGITTIRAATSGRAPPMRAVIESWKTTIPVAASSTRRTTDARSASTRS